MLEPNQMPLRSIKSLSNDLVTDVSPCDLSVGVKYRDASAKDSEDDPMRGRDTRENITHFHLLSLRRNAESSANKRVSQENAPD
ncbi:hypothetical protein CEXT_514621 [Caerostris extrusa]|uniref:Uncharacterized protein n=1 Tax=Caerostris extrusa TaxID=172846 RepID=A0AAV4QRT3_CAEEX|nr:hypothetical protein CEXT_514621 [Caerostris extrusa]